jgi:hypothetical protein
MDRKDVIRTQIVHLAQKVAMCDRWIAHLDGEPASADNASWRQHHVDLKARCLKAQGEWVEELMTLEPDAQ